MGCQKVVQEACQENVFPGRDEDKTRILQLLLGSGHDFHDQEHNVSVLSIVGIGGLGKTAIAHLMIYKKVQQHFELRPWGWVSYVFDVKTVL